MRHGILACVVLLLLVPRPVRAGDDASAAYRTETRCAHPELFLVDHPLDELDAVFAKACPGQRLHFAAWMDECAVRDYLRNAIFAAHGKRFRSRKWRDIFGKAVWYRPRADYRKGAVSRTGWDNVRALQRGCEDTAQRRRDRRLLRRWLLALQADDHRRAAKMMRFPFHTGGEVARSCERIDGASKKVTTCLTGWRASLSGVLKGWTTSPAVIYSYEDPGGLYAPPLGGLSPDTRAAVRILRVNFAPGDLACMMKVDPKLEDQYLEDCGGSGLSTTVAIAGDGAGARIVASHWFGGAACPYVYVETPAGPVFQGEILRNRIGADAYASETLVVEPAAGDHVDIVLSEEKPEVSYIDDVLLEWGALRLRPTLCAGEHAVCEQDQRFHVLRPGEQLRLRFEVPGERPAGAPRLRASGYYVPLR